MDPGGPGPAQAAGCLAPEPPCSPKKHRRRKEQEEGRTFLPAGGRVQARHPERAAPPPREPRQLHERGAFSSARAARTHRRARTHRASTAPRTLLDCHPGMCSIPLDPCCLECFEHAACILLRYMMRMCEQEDLTFKIKSLFKVTMRKGEVDGRGRGRRQTRIAKPRKEGRKQEGRKDNTWNE